MAKQPVTEVEAMKVVDDALAGLEPEARNRVLVWASSKYPVQRPKQGGGAGGKKEKEIDTPAETGGGSLGHVKDFVVKKQPDSIYERVACLAYYLEKAKGITAFKAKDIEKANIDARQGKIDNVPQVLSDATRRYGFLALVGGGKKALTAAGEALVEALPDREKVKAAAKKGRRRVRKAHRTKK